MPELRNRVSPQVSEKGLSANRRWGVKDHIEQRPSVPAGSVRSNELRFNWQKLYLQEKAIIGSLARDALPDSPSSP